MFGLGRVVRRSGQSRLLLEQLRSSVACLATPHPAPASKIVFDPLEPRLLLNADAMTVDMPTIDPGRQQSDLLIRLFDEQQLVETSPTVRQQVQVLDRGDQNRVLAEADWDDITSIAIVGGPGNDRLTVDVASFAGREVPIVAFVAGDGEDELSIDGAAVTDWTSDGNGGGHTSGGVSVSFSGVEHVSGGGADTLRGASTDTDWVIDGVGAGRSAI